MVIGSGKTDEVSKLLRKPLKEVFGKQKLSAILDELVEVAPLNKNKDYYKYLQELLDGAVEQVYAKLLTLQEEAVLRFYTTKEGYKNLNRALRNEIELTEELAAQEKLMNRALDKLPDYKTDALLYRIENLTEAQINSYYIKEKTITNKHFTSSSYDELAIGKAMERRPHNILIRIKTKTGKLIEPISTYKKEKEILFKSNTMFYVEDIRLTLSPEDYLTKIKTIILIEK